MVETETETPKTAEPANVDSTQKEYIESIERHMALVDEYNTAAWASASDFLKTEKPGLHLLFALGRAYYALYNTCVAAAHILEIDLKPFQAGSRHHEAERAIPHSQLPVLVAHLMNLIHVPKKLGKRSASSEQAFETTRALQTYRKRADYLGCERVTHRTATECIQWAKTLVEDIWGYTREQWSNQRAGL